jgi:hypothetical protein
VHYSWQDNHAHLIVEAHDKIALGRGMMAITARLARAVNRVAGRRGPVFAERHHLELLPTPRQVRNALRYVLLNARRHTGRWRDALTTRVRLDPASSARWFDGWRPDRLAGVECDGPAGPPAVARARTWLLAVGWRRHGCSIRAMCRELTYRRGAVTEPLHDASALSQRLSCGAYERRNDVLDRDVSNHPRRGSRCEDSRMRVVPRSRGR